MERSGGSERAQVLSAARIPDQTLSPREVLPGVWRITQPLPFPPRHVHVYLVLRPEGHLLIDCGMDLPEPREALRQGLQAAGVAWREIREIVLTHVHPDHCSLTPELLRLTGAAVPSIYGPSADEGSM